MKYKKFCFLFLSILLLMVILGVAGCNSSHKCVFNIKSTGHEYFSSSATCNKADSYWYSCECGKKSDSQKFYIGNPLGHNYSAATCTTPATCSRCFKTTGIALGHAWVGNICIEKTTCSRCYGESVPTGHSFSTATCTTPKTCTRCSTTTGASLGHNYSAATCTTPKTCTRCSTTTGASLGHNYSAATCTTPKTCTRCSTTNGSALGHNWRNITCNSTNYCSLCNEKKYITHEYIETTYSNGCYEKYCKYCRAGNTTHDWLYTNDFKTYQKDLQFSCMKWWECSKCKTVWETTSSHKWKDATCEKAKTCIYCGTEEGLPLPHTWQQATCITPKQCLKCDLIDSAPLGHSTSSGTCSRCHISQGYWTVEVDSFGLTVIKTKNTIKNNGLEANVFTDGSESYFTLYYFGQPISFPGDAAIMVYTEYDTIVYLNNNCFTGLQYFMDEYFDLVSYLNKYKTLKIEIISYYSNMSVCHTFNFTLKLENLNEVIDGYNNYYK